LISLELGNREIDDGALTPLAKCKALRHLRVKNLEIPSCVLRAIGDNLVSLECVADAEGSKRIVEYCPNLEHLCMGFYHYDEEGEYLGDDFSGKMERRVKSGLKRLVKLVSNRRTIRLGTDWEGGDVVGIIGGLRN
jgi:hypothetical protein